MQTPALDQSLERCLVSGAIETINLANFLRTLATPIEIGTWSLTSLRERLIKTGARLVRHARFAVFQFAEAALPRRVFAGILARINGLRDPPSETAPA